MPRTDLRTRPAIAALCAAAVVLPVTPAVAAPGALPAAPAAAPAAPAAPAAAPGRIDRVALTARSTTAEVGAEREVASARLATDDVNVAAVTWDADDDAELVSYMRVRTATGWTDWIEVHDDHHEPDPGTDARAGTEPFVTEDASAIEVKVVAAAGTALPGDLTLELVDPGTDPDDAVAAELRPEDGPSTGTASTTSTGTAGTASTSTAATAPAAGLPVVAPAVHRSAVPLLASTARRVAVPPKPLIRTRAEWGANERLRQNYGRAVQYGTVKGGFVHHTAGTNSYSREDVPALIRGIYRYHVESRDFVDIGYNFLVDRFGRLWEGAYGGMDRAVVAAHTKYYNSQSFALSAIGDYTSRAPESAVLDAYGRLFAWKLGVHGIGDPTGTSAYSGTSATSQRTISGHRDTKQTACPGQRLYDALPTIRSRALAAMRDVPSDLALTGPTTTPAATYTVLAVTWRAGTVPVTGRADLQVLHGGTWKTVREVRVVDGAASVAVAPVRTSGYRLRATGAYNPTNVDTDYPEGVSPSFRVTVVAPGEVASTLRVEAPRQTVARAYTPLELTWHAGSTPVTGTAALQVVRSGSWTTVREVAVTGGVGRTAVAPATTSTYRLAMVQASSPAGVATAVATSPTTTVEVVASADQLRDGLTLAGPATTSAGGYTRLQVAWHAAGWAVDGTVRLEVLRAGLWVAVREVAVVDGLGSTAVAPNATSSYRLVTTTVTRPSTLAPGQASEPVVVTVS